MTVFLSFPRLKRKVMVRKSIEKAQGLMLSTSAAPPMMASCFPTSPMGMMPAKLRITTRRRARQSPTNHDDQRFSKKDVIDFCAGGGNRTRISNLEGSYSTTKLRPQFQAQYLYLQEFHVKARLPFLSFRCLL